jgi:predicted RNA-binding Zn ribbon-like protein
LLGFLLSFGLSPSFSATAVVYAAGEDDDMRLHQGNTLILQQLFKSSYLRDTLINKHQLQKRYGIASDAPQAQAQTYRELADHLAIERTVFNALEITATDPDPRFAAQLANSAARLISAANDQLIRDNKSQRLAVLRARLKERRKIYDSLLNNWKRALRQINQNRTLPAALRQNPRRPLGQELSRERVKKAHAALEKHREKLRQGREHLAHPPPAAYLASKAIAPAEPSRPLRLLWAFLGAVVLSSTTLLYYTLYHLWKGFPA